MRMSERRKTILLTLLILSPVGVILFLWAACSPPSDKVDIRLEGRPQPVDFLCLVADTPTGPEPMHWYLVVLGSWSSHPPDGKGWATPGLGTGNGSPVRWKPGNRYGVVTYVRGGDWQVYWFRPDDVPVQRTRYLGDRDVTFDLTGRTPEALTQAQVTQLGLAGVPDELKAQSNP